MIGIKEFTLFLSFCGFYVYLERKIEKEIKKFTKDIERREEELYKILTEIKQDIKQDIALLKQDLRYKASKNNIYRLNDY